jgi:hypothetical protein
LESVFVCNLIRESGECRGKSPDYIRLELAQICPHLFGRQECKDYLAGENEMLLDLAGEGLICS